MNNLGFDFPQNIGTARFGDDVLSVLTQIARRDLPAVPIAFYGSSSFRLWESMAEDLNSLDVVNLGFGGGTHASGILYLDRLLAPLAPKKVVLYFGENDISNDGLDAQTVLENLKSLLARIEQRCPEADIFILSAKQSPTKWLYSNVVDDFNKLLFDYCAKEAGLTYVDVTSNLIGKNGRPISGLYKDDGVHLNRSGYARWAAILKSVPGLFRD